MLQLWPSKNHCCASNWMKLVEYQSDVLIQDCRCSASRGPRVGDIFALSYLSAKQVRCQVHWPCRTMQVCTGKWSAPKGSGFKCVHFSQSYGVILLLLGIIRRWPRTSASHLKAPVTPTLCLAMQIKLFPIPSVFKSHVIFLLSTLHQKKRQKRKSMMIAAMPATGPYCLSSSSQLMRTAARLYLAESSRKRLLMSPILSRLSPR